MTSRFKGWFFLAYLAFLLPSFTFSQQSHLILAIGDSHGAWETGWVNQLRKLRPADSILNVAISGNTIGFDNLGNESLNELRNIQRHLADAKSADQNIDYIIVLLGTNDCKAVFDSLQHEVPGNLVRLMKIINTFNYQQQQPPKIILTTPPPIAPDEYLDEKYRGAKKRLNVLLLHYITAAEKFNSTFVNIHASLTNDFESISKDGIHLTEEGYRRIALMLNDVMMDKH